MIVNKIYYTLKNKNSKYLYIILSDKFEKGFKIIIVVYINDNKW